MIQNPFSELLITYVLMAAIALVSYLGFKRPVLMNKLIFHPHSVLQQGQWYRLLTSGFIHANWNHLLLNLLVLFFFGRQVEYMFRFLYGPALGMVLTLGLFLASVVLGSVPDLLQQKDNPSYRALGASGGASGYLFAFIIFFPTDKVCLYFALCIPGIIFGVAYLFYSWWAAKRQQDNIGHLAHFAGAITGVVYVLAVRPATAIEFAQTLAGWLSF